MLSYKALVFETFARLLCESRVPANAIKIMKSKKKKIGIPTNKPATIRTILKKTLVGVERNLFPQ